MPNDSTVTVRLRLDEVDSYGNIDDLIVNIVVVKTETNILTDVVFPVSIVIAGAILLFLLLIKLRPNKKIDKLLDNYERMISKIFGKTKK